MDSFAVLKREHDGLQVPIIYAHPNTRAIKIDCVAHTVLGKQIDLPTDIWVPAKCTGASDIWPSVEQPAWLCVFETG